MSSGVAERGAPAFTLDRPRLLMTDPEHFRVSYTINPWMQPDLWAADEARHRCEARAAFEALRRALLAAGAEIEILPGRPGLPDMVFPANAAVVLGRRAVMARFRHPERQGEQAPFRTAFEALRDRGLLDAVLDLPQGCVQEGAGDCIWDATRGLFWAGHGPRSNQAGAGAISRIFDREVVGLELVSDRFYHLDTCFCPLSGGDVLYYPAAFSPASLARLRAVVAADQLVEASDEDAARFCVNAVCLGRSVIMAQAAPRLRVALEARGYRLSDVDLAPFILSGGGAFCMTLRLDRCG